MCWDEFGYRANLHERPPPTFIHSKSHPLDQLRWLAVFMVLAVVPMLLYTVFTVFIIVQYWYVSSPLDYSYSNT